ncbi:hypothetical protein IJ541_08730 [bacterium]|nr:hypothetical protein [bacterium]MBQ9246925.1 hypothetical protein [bacterium]
MYNSIPQIERKNLDSFGLKGSKSNPNRFWLPANIRDIQNTSKDSYVNNSYLPDPRQIFISPDEARKTNNLKIIGLSIAGVTVLTAAGIFFVLKGGPKNLSKNLKKLSEYFERKILESKLNTDEAPNRVFLYLSKTLNHASQKAEAVNNFTSFKDMLFKKIMNSNKYFGKLHDKITHLFEKIGRRSVLSSYEDTNRFFELAFEASKSASRRAGIHNLDEIIEINGVKLTKEEWLKKASGLMTEIGEDYSKNFGKTSLKSRYYKYKKAAENLKAAFAKLKVFWSTDVINKFMAESAIAKEKNIIQTLVRSQRQGLSYNLADMAENSNHIILDIVREISYKDAKNITKLGKIRGDLQKLIASGGKDAVLKRAISRDINSIVREIEGALQNKTIKEDRANVILSKLAELKSEISGFKQGKIQDILDIYKGILSEDEYKLLEKSYRKGIKSLDKSIHVETEDFLSKLRDLTLGSAPTDILTMVGSLGILGYHLGKSEDNEQRRSIALKYGFPALAGIGVSLYCNAKLFAGSKSLLAGSISSWVLNRIGAWGDKKLKEYSRKQSPQNTN